MAEKMTNKSFMESVKDAWVLHTGSVGLVYPIEGINESYRSLLLFEDAGAAMQFWKRFGLEPSYHPRPVSACDPDELFDAGYFILFHGWEGNDWENGEITTLIKSTLMEEEETD